MPSRTEAVALAKEIEPGRSWTAEICDDRLVFRSPGMTWAQLFAFKDAIEKRVPDGLQADVSSMVFP